ncbi:2-dehydro-3-deoxygluconokinase [Halobacillus dabanensis]|uniref:2-dehydro-3-deoxygluconokinase n=1 Tax=Halobacillus dabanensis TaxID=240302 RepID=A0A1I3UHC5_HALDA|nr:2-dehydro-3-deoxygluconokinase [Halobacillus dabanensis]
MDVITLGESMVLFKPGSTGPLRYVDSYRKTVGGAETNVAIALTRLDHQIGRLD